MTKRKLFFSALFVAFTSTSAGCGPKATPVTPQPLSAPEQAEMARALAGSWRLTAVRIGDGEKKDDSSTNVQFAFDGAGKYRHIIGTPFGTLDKSYEYRLDGRNVVTNSPHGTYRIDAVTPSTLDLFNYDASVVWYLARQ